MPCKEYEALKATHDMEMESWAQFTYPQNAHLRGSISDRKAKQIAKEARARASEKSMQMHAHREFCEACRGEG